MLALSNRNAILLTTQQAYVAYGRHYSIFCMACNISLQIIIITIIIILLSLLILLHFHSNIRSLKTWWSTSFKASHSATFLTHNTYFVKLNPIPNSTSPVSLSTIATAQFCLKTNFHLHRKRFAFHSTSFLPSHSSFIFRFRLLL